MNGIDLFSGCGGLTLGFQNAGFNILAAFDNWLPAVKVYKENFKHDMIFLDLSVLRSYEVFIKYKPDIILGGPPCQDFSSAGKRNENLGRANLTISFANIISHVKPKYFLMENVERIVRSKALEKAIKIFKKCGYGISLKILNASFCGVPQTRKRFFMFGELNGNDGVLNYYLEKNLASKPLTLKQYFGNELDLEHYYRHPRSYERRAIFSINEPSPTIRGVNRPVPKTYKKHPGDTFKTLLNIRPLTTIERSFIQTFPKNFKFNGRKTELEQMIGNAVPVKLAEYVANCINEYIKDESKPVLLFRNN
jgi:DNA (cytosine-5)-methyltransferase 1